MMVDGRGKIHHVEMVALVAVGIINLPHPLCYSGLLLMHDWFPHGWVDIRLTLLVCVRNFLNVLAIKGVYWCSLYF